MQSYPAIRPRHFARTRACFSSAGVQTNKADDKRGKGTGGKFRIMYTERSAAYDAKNRLGLSSEIEMGDSAAEAWAAFMAAIKAGRGIQKEAANDQVKQ